MNLLCFQGIDKKVVTRFYLTLVLYNLWRQKTVWQVSAKFQLARGFIQNFLNSATSFASCVLHFCQVSDIQTTILFIMNSYKVYLHFCSALFTHNAF